MQIEPEHPPQSNAPIIDRADHDKIKRPPARICEEPSPAASSPTKILRHGTIYEITTSQIRSAVARVAILVS